MGEKKEIDFDKLQKALEAKIAEQEEVENEEVEEPRESKEAAVTPKEGETVDEPGESSDEGFDEIIQNDIEMESGDESGEDLDIDIKEVSDKEVIQKADEEAGRTASDEFSHEPSTLSGIELGKKIGNRIRNEIRKKMGEDPEEQESNPEDSEKSDEERVDYSQELEKQKNFERRFLGETAEDNEAVNVEPKTKKGTERELAKALTAATIFVEGGNKRDEKFPEEEEAGPSIAERTHAVISNLNEYKERIWAYRKRKWVRMALIALGVLIILFTATQVVKYWRYSSYSLQTELISEETSAVSYEKIGDNVVKFSLDGATFYDDRGNILWTSTYTMNAPAVENCGDTMVIYDTQGTAMKVYQENGEIGNISTDMPIIKAKVAKQGVVAAILESGENTWIQYYDKDGSNIASFKTTLDSPGYPLDLSLSEDGLLMAVSYIQINKGMTETQIGFYNWSSIGQNQMDNMVNSYSLKDSIAPQTEYLDASTCLVLRDNGFTIYEGQQIPKQEAAVDEEKEIISAFYNRSYVGYVVHSEDSDKAFTMKVYNLKGQEIFKEDFDFDYDQITMDDNQILMYNNKQMCIYSLSGVKKFEGDIKEGVLSKVLPFSPNRYMLVTEGGTCTIKLK